MNVGFFVANFDTSAIPHIPLASGSWGQIDNHFTKNISDVSIICKAFLFSHFIIHIKKGCFSPCFKTLIAVMPEIWNNIPDLVIRKK